VRGDAYRLEKYLMANEDVTSKGSEKGEGGDSGLVCFNKKRKRAGLKK
jgi:hypothetical protein